MIQNHKNNKNFRIDAWIFGGKYPRPCAGVARVPFVESRAGTERDSEHQSEPRGKADGTFVAPE